MAVRSKYQPFSFQERITPLAMLQEQYDKTNENLIALGEQAMQYYQYLDPETKAAVDQYNTELSNVAGSLASEGMRAVSRNTLTKLRAMYNNQVKPINEAAQTLSKMYEDQRNLESKLNASGQRLFSSRMPTVKELLENPGATPQNVGSGALYAQGQAASKSASMRRFSESAFGSEIIRGYINQVKEQGYSPELVSRFMQDVNTIPELRDAYNSIREMYNTAGLTNPDEANKFIMQGLLDGIMYSKESTQKEDIIGKENRAYARQVALAKLNADLEVDTARRKAAMTKASSGAQARTRTLVSPRARNVAAQKFYDSKSNTVNIPDTLFDKDGKLKKPTSMKGGRMIGTVYTPTQYDKNEKEYNELMSLLRENYTDEQISNMNKDEIKRIVGGMVNNSLQDAQGNSAFYWNLDISNTKELLSRVGELYEVESKEDGKWRYSRGTKNVRADQKDKGSELIYDPVSDELFLSFDDSKKLYRLDKSAIGDEEMIKRIETYTSRDANGNSMIDNARNNIEVAGRIVTDLSEKAKRNGGKLSEADMITYQQAYDAYENAVAVLEDSEELFSEIGTTIMSYLKKTNE